MAHFLEISMHSFLFGVLLLTTFVHIKLVFIPFLGVRHHTCLITNSNIVSQKKWKLRLAPELRECVSFKH